MKGDKLVPGPEKMNIQMKSMINSWVMITGYNFLVLFKDRLFFFATENISKVDEMYRRNNIYSKGKKQ